MFASGSVDGDGCRLDSPHGHVAPVYHHRSEAGSRLLLRSRSRSGSGSGLAGTRAAASGHQFGTVWDTFTAADVAGVYQLLQDVVGLGVVAEAVQHPQDVAVTVAQLEETLHFGVLLLLMVHGRLGFTISGLHLLPLRLHPPRLLLLGLHVGVLF